MQVVCGGAWAPVADLLSSTGRAVVTQDQSRPGVLLYIAQVSNFVMLFAPLPMQTIPPPGLALVLPWSLSNL